MPRSSDHTQIKREAGVLFERYLSCSADIRDSLREQLLEKHLTPLYRTIFRRVLGVDVLREGGVRNTREEMAQDAYLEAYLAMNRQLERWSAREASPPAPEMFLNYAAMVAYHAIKKRRQMAQSKGSSLYDPQIQVYWLLTRCKGLARWQTQNGLLCGGYMQWQEEGRPEASGSVRDALQRDVEDFTLAGLAKRKIEKPLRECNPVELLMALLDQAEAPLEYAVLVNAFAALAHIVGPGRQEIAVAPISNEKENPFDRSSEPSDGGSTLQETLDEEARRSLLQRLWEQILRLPLNQRRALLLNFPEMDMRTLPIRSIAGFSEISEALEMSQAELAALWNHLPLADSAIATALAVTEPQVKNLRQSAYRTLAWRMRPFSRGALNQLWRAALQLPAPKGAVFMLYVRDSMGASLLALLPREGYANRQTIASHLQLPPEMLDRIWPELPLGFSKIATLLAKPPSLVAQIYAAAREELETYIEALQGE